LFIFIVIILSQLSSSHILTNTLNNEHTARIRSTAIQSLTLVHRVETAGFLERNNPVLHCCWLVGWLVSNGTFITKGYIMPCEN